MIYAGSRYENGILTKILDATGATEVVVTRPSITVRRTRAVLITSTPVRLDILADQYYSDPTLWWVIADANPDVRWFLEIPPGKRVVIPDVATTVR